MRLFLLLLACGSADALVVVTVSSSVQLNEVRALHATAVAASHTTEFDVTPVDAGAFSVPPSRTFGVEVPEAFAGPFSLSLEARDDVGRSLASGSGSTNASAGQRTELAVTLGANRDGGP